MLSAHLMAYPHVYTIWRDFWLREQNWLKWERKCALRNMLVKLQSCTSQWSPLLMLGDSCSAWSHSEKCSFTKGSEPLDWQESLWSKGLWCRIVLYSESSAEFCLEPLTQSSWVGVKHLSLKTPWEEIAGTVERRGIWGRRLAVESWGICFVNYWMISINYYK